MTGYYYKVKTKWGWKIEASSSKKEIDSERAFAKRHGYKVTPVIKLPKRVVRITNG